MAGSLTPQAIAQRWQQSMASPQTQQRYTEGINNYQGNPMQKAAERADAYAQGTMNAVSSGRFQNALNATPVSRWKNNSISKAGRLTSGAQAAQDKYVQAMGKWAGVYQSVKDTVSQMPKGGIANAQARAAKAIEMLMSAAGKL